MRFTGNLIFCTSRIKFSISSKTGRYFYRLNKRYFSSKHTFELLPEVQEKLDSGDMKHRKHPGVRKMAPIQLPPNLVKAIDKLIYIDNEKTIKLESQKLLNKLALRRLPIEQDELSARIQKYTDDDSGVPDDTTKELTKQQLDDARRKIKFELKRWQPIEYNYHECLAYLMGRLAPNYAAVMKVFTEIKRQHPTFNPKSFFDFGSGVGSAIWAAHTTWNDTLEEYFCVDASPYMNEVAQTLLTDETTEEMLVNNIFFRQFLPGSESVKYDLVICAFSLLDLPSVEERVRVIDTLWRKTNDILVIIEFGNFAGFFSVLDARDYILQLENQHKGGQPGNQPSGAHVVMPCPHEFSCPMMEVGTKQSCGIYVSYETLFPRHRQQIKKDWISYVVLRKGQRPKDIIPWPRIVQPVLKKSKHVYCRACYHNGQIKETIVTRGKHGRHAYRCARSSYLGDLLPVNLETTGITEQQESNCDKDVKNPDVVNSIDK